ncbi:hypothetical protein AVEN_217145-1 [Araneus ventricosus]|uniref:MATH domain-containing protein n=1 Tax=Araneus ventricosus TaxID=182803 RepID=A0A4Y2TV33_ARAVE|nr:hypothetical protein AVEN_217145-1 [Araneus ventricosus]
MADKGKQTNGTNRRINCVEKMRTRILDHYCNIDWRIDNFSKHYRDIYSDVITPYCDCRTKWKVAIRFNGNTMNLGFKRCDGEQDIVKGTFHLSVENSAGQVYDKATVEQSDVDVLTFLPRPSTSSKELYDEEGKSFKLMEDDVLVVKGAMDLNGCCIKTTCFVGFS